MQYILDYTHNDIVMEFVYAIVSKILTLARHTIAQ